MTVAPRYAEYSDALDTGVSVPLQLPCMAATPARNTDTEQPAAPPALQAAAPAGEPADVLSSSSPSHLVSDPFWSAAGRDGSSPEAAIAASAGECDELRKGEGQVSAGLSTPRARYFLCRSHRVDRVFVEHPIYHNTTDIYGSNVNTYVEPGKFPNLDVRYSILCQAALAAPLLLWAGNSSSTPAAAQDAAAAAAEVTAAKSAGPGEAQQESAGLVFVGNDWPCAPLALRLSLSRRAVQQLPATPAPGASDSAAGDDQATSPTHSSPLPTVEAATHVPIQDETFQRSDSRRLGTDSGSRHDAVAPQEAVPTTGGLPILESAPGAAEDGDKDAGFAARLQGSLQGAASAFCIHNLAYQGCCGAETFPRLCLPDAALPALLWPPQNGSHDAACAAQGTPLLPALPEGDLDGTGTGALWSADSHLHSLPV